MDHTAPGTTVLSVGSGEQGYGDLRQSASPAGTGFFFVEKKDKTLRTGIDYRGLVDIMEKTATHGLPGPRVGFQ